MHELAEDWTFKFEEQTKGREWNGEFFEEIEAFFDEQLKNSGFLKIIDCMEYINMNNITDNKRVIKLLEKRTEIENKIKELDKMALVKFELEKLGMTYKTDEPTTNSIKNIRS